MNNSQQTLQKEACALLKTFVNIQTSSYYIKGLQTFMATIKPLIKALSPDTLKVSHLKKAPILVARKYRKNAPHVLFNIHIDTVFDRTSSFNTFIQNGDYATGPGVIDAKGGCVILLKTLEYLECLHPPCPIGWTIVFNSDEEIGTPISRDILLEEAKKSDIGIVFEPCLPKGEFISKRPASANINVESFGKKAHAGRDYKKGNNAIVHLITFLRHIQTQANPSIQLNIGTISGGERENIIPDHAKAMLNTRCFSQENHDAFIHNLTQEAKIYNQAHNAKLVINVDTYRPGNPLTPAKKTLFKHLKTCLAQHSITLQTKASYGVCDGNFIAAAGIPTIDTFGPLGSGMHTENETIYLPSLSEKIITLTEFIHHIATHYTSKGS